MMTNEPVNPDHVELDLGGAAGISDRGLRHDRNEDAMALRGVPGTSEFVAVVCDGVSNSDDPDQGSRAAADAAVDVLVEGRADGGEPEAVTRSAVAAAAEAVQKLVPDEQPPGDEQPSGPACTYLSAIVTHETVTVGWVGDSRAYWLAAEGTDPVPECVTSDDTWAALLVAEGQLSQEEAENHHLSHVLVSWLGAGAGEVRPHVLTLWPDGPGVVLLCSDGLWNYRPAVGELLDEVRPGTARTPLEVADELTELALDEGGHDNITVVVIPFPPTGESD